ncbi:hypothetical protein GH5_05418 [Leishmania sp. Ghana 2012 LV757]|uniref:hypothetical protein n=1 Tax=Leishmania sp. Ghana 2012 LV757 TaxID=2803181 RepID=UPI001B44640C|nr:hypothetical protein GH5_05418 [Leishmania sp. Ghana 2012 LV757]
MLQTVVFGRLYARAGLLLLLLSLLAETLFPLGAPGVAPVYAAPSLAMEVPPRGSTLFRQRLPSHTKTTPIVSSVMVKALAVGLSSSTGSNAREVINGTSMEVTPMLFKHKYALMPGIVVSPAEAAGKTNDNLFLRTEAALNNVGKPLQLEDVRKLLSKSVQPVTSLSEGANSKNSNQTELVGGVTYYVTLLFCGSPSSWSTALTTNRSSISSTIMHSVEAQTSSVRIVCTASVDFLLVLLADPSFKTIGDGSGGLLVGLTVNCSRTDFMRGRFLNEDEFASSLLLLNTTNITAALQNASGTVAVAVLCQTLVRSTGDLFVCDGACKGMIAMGCVLAVLITICIAATLISICCLWHFVRTGGENATLQPVLVGPLGCKTADTRALTTSDTTVRSMEVSNHVSLEPSPSTVPYGGDSRSEHFDVQAT